jgi:hypothetical protein
MLKMEFNRWVWVLLAAAWFTGPPGACSAGEVDAGEVPAEHLSSACRTLPWGVEVWNLEDAVGNMINGAAVLWIDTRPANLTNEGSLRGAVWLPFNKSGAEGNELNREQLLAAVTASGYSKDTVKIVFFSEKSDCQRSYNAAYTAVAQWGIDPARIIWYRDGYPEFFCEIRDNPLLRCKARIFLNEEALKQH